MQDNLFRKGMVFAVVVLFIGAGIVPNISGNIKKSSSGENVNTTDNINNRGPSTFTSPPGWSEDIRLTFNSYELKHLFENII